MTNFDNRENPPDDDDWPHIWSALSKARKGWVITGPIHAAVTNWKALLVVGSVIAYLRGDAVIELLAQIIRGSQ